MKREWTHLNRVVGCQGHVSTIFLEPCLEIAGAGSDGRAPWKGIVKVHSGCFAQIEAGIKV